MLNWLLFCLNQVISLFHVKFVDDHFHKRTILRDTTWSILANGHSLVTSVVVVFIVKINLVRFWFWLKISNINILFFEFIARHRRIHTNPNPGRGARNAKNNIVNPVNVNPVKMPTAQSFASLPASAIQLIPVSMSTQIRGATSLGHSSWVPSLPNSRPNSQTSVDNLNKSPEHSRNQASNQVLNLGLPHHIHSPAQMVKHEDE